MSTSNYRWPGAIQPKKRAAQSVACLSFDGTNDYVDVGNSNTLNPGVLTLSVWMKSSQVSGLKALVSRYDNTPDSSWMLWANGTTLKWYTKGLTGTDPFSLDGVTDVFDDVWHHIVCTVNGSLRVIYIDGIFDSSHLAGGGIQPNTVSVLFGNATGIGFYAGLLDDVAIFDRALSLAEIKYIATGSLDVAELLPVGLWRMEEGTGTDLADTGALTRRNSLDFDGSTGVVSFAAPTGITSEITMMFWCYFDVISNDRNLLNLTSVGGGSTNGVRLAFSGAFVGFILANLADVYFTPPSTGTWTHIAARYNGSEIRVYVNGSSVVSSSVSGALYWGSAVFGSIGGQTGSGTPGDYHDGKMADVAVFDYAVDASDIADVASGAKQVASLSPYRYWKLTETTGSIVDSSGNNGHGTLVGGAAFSTDLPDELKGNPGTISGATWDTDVPTPLTRIYRVNGKWPGVIQPQDATDAPTDVEGSAAITLDAVTLSSAGTAAVAGAAAVTLASVALSSAGVVPVVGACSVTLDAATLLSTSTVPVVGSSAITLDAATLVSAGTVPVIGASAVTLDAVTLVSAGTVPVVGASDITLGAATLSSAGVAAVVGSSAITLGDLTLTSSGGGAGPVGDLSVTLDALTLSSAGVAPVVGAVAYSLAALSLSTDGVASGPVGIVSVTLASVTLASAGVAPVVGSCAITLGAATTSSAGAVAVVGACAVSLADLTLVSDGAGGATATGELAVTLDALTLTSTGLVAVVGSGAITLQAASLVSTATVPVVGTASVSLAALAVSTAGTVPVVGSVSYQLASITFASAGTAGTAGEASNTLASLVLSTAGTAAVAGSLSVTLSAATSSSTGTSGVIGVLSATLASVSLGATGTIPVQGVSSTALSAVTLASVGSVSVIGSLGVSLGTILLSAEGVTNHVFGDADISLGALTCAATCIIQNPTFSGVFRQIGKTELRYFHARKPILKIAWPVTGIAVIRSGQLYYRDSLFGPPSQRTVTAGEVYRNSRLVYIDYAKTSAVFDLVIRVR